MKNIYQETTFLVLRNRLPFVKEETIKDYYNYLYENDFDKENLKTRVEILHSIMKVEIRKELERRLKDEYWFFKLNNSKLPQEVEDKISNYINDFEISQQPVKIDIEFIAEDFDMCYPDVEFILKDYVLNY